MLGDLGRGFLDPDCRAEIDLQLEGGLARFRKGFHLDDGPCPYIDLEKIIESDRRCFISRLCHVPVSLRMSALPGDFGKRGPSQSTGRSAFQAVSSALRHP